MKKSKTSKLKKIKIPVIVGIITIGVIIFSVIGKVLNKRTYSAEESCECHKNSDGSCTLVAEVGATCSKTGQACTCPENQILTISIPSGVNRTYNGKSTSLYCPSGSTKTGGASSIKNAGAYSITCSTNVGYKWTDGTQGSKTVYSNINKKSISVTWDGITPTADTGIDGETILLDPETSDGINYTATCASVTGGDCKNYLLSNNTYSLQVIHYNPPGDITYDGKKHIISCPIGSTGSGTLEATNVGKYKFGCTPLPGYSWGIVDGDETMEYEWSIVKAKVNKPISPSPLVYTGASQNAPLSCPSGTEIFAFMSVTNATEIGTYSFTCYPDENHMWEDESTSNYEVTWSIIGEIDKPTSPSAKTYNGSQQTYDTCPENSSIVTGSQTTGSNAGKYTLTCKPNQNYRWKDGSTGNVSVEWEINKKILTVIWTGKTPHVNTGVNGETMNLGYSVEENNIRAWCANVNSANGCDNYSLKNDVYNVSIANIPSVKDYASVYDGTIHTVTCPSGSTLSIDKDIKNAGSYIATCTLKARYIWDDETTGAIEIRYTVSKKVVNITWNGNTPKGSTGVSGETINLSYNISPTSNTARVSCDSVTNGDCNNYDLSGEKTKQFQPISPVFNNNTFSYDGTSHSISCPAGSSVSSGSSTAINPGTYTVKCSPNSGNYWNDTKTTDAKEFSWSVTVPTINLTWNNLDASASNTSLNIKLSYSISNTKIIASCLSVGGYANRCDYVSLTNREKTISRVTKPTGTYEKVYTGSMQATPIVCPTGTHIGANDTASATDVGEYTRTCVLDNGYMWSNSSDRSDSSVTLKWNIIKKTLTVPTINKIFEYNGLEQETGVSCPNGSNLGGVSKAKNAGDYTQICTITDINNYKWDSISSNSAMLHWTINKKSVEVTWDGGEASAKGVNTELIHLKTPTFDSATGRYRTSCESVTGGDCSNYLIIDNKIIYTIVNIPSDSSAIIVYDGTTHSSGVSCPTGSSEDYDSVSSAVAAGSYTQICVANEGYVWSDGTFGTKKIRWSISKRGINIVPKDQTITYGDDIVNNTSMVTHLGLASGDIVSSVVLTPSTTNATNYGKITASGAIIKNASGSEILNNYEITYSTGKLIINKKELTVPNTPNDKVYNSEAQDSGIVCPENSIFYSGTPSATNVGNYEVRCWIDDFGNYKWDKSTTRTVSIPWKITPASLTITSLPQTITYLDRIQPFSKGVNVYTSGIQKNDVFESVQLSQSIINAGEGEVIISSPVIKRGSTNVTSNYTISYNNGKLTINKRKIAAPTSVQISSSGVVTWGVSRHANLYEVKVGANGSISSLSGTSINLYNTLKEASGTRTVYVRAKNSDSDNYEASDFVSNSINVYSITVENPLGRGVINFTGGGNYIQGESASVGVSVYSGFKFEKWLHSGLYSTNQTYSISNVSKNETFTAVISKIDDTDSSNDNEKPSKPTFDIIKYNEFLISSDDNIGVAGYYVSKNNTKPSASDTNWRDVANYVVDSADTYYVWTKDAAGNISDYESISVYNITFDIATGVHLYLDDNHGNRLDDDTIVLNGTVLNVVSSLDAGYNNLQIKANDNSISNNSNYEIKDNVKFTVTVGFNNTKPIVSITRINYNTFMWSASTNGNEISEYAITNSNSIPDNWNPVGNVTMDQYSISNSGKYYVWIKDSVGNISEPAIIDAYLIEYASGDGTTLEARYDSNSKDVGTEFNTDIVVLNGTEIWVNAKLNGSNYKDLVLRKDDVIISGNTSYVINDNTKFESSATIIDTNKYYNVDYTKDSNYIYNLDNKITKSNYIDSIPHTDNYRIEISNDDSILSDNDLIGTGSVTKIFDGNTLVKQYTNVVTGDVTGDGEIKLGDISLLFKHFKQRETLVNAFLKAGDVTGDEEVKLGDVSKLYKFYKNRISSLD